MRYASMICERSRNLGDEIQGIAAARLLPRVDGFVPRERLDQVDVATVVVLNGWFGPRDLSWPPSPHVHPVYFGFHITARHDSVERVLSPDGVEHLRGSGPIGCRDDRTRALLEDRGIEAFTSWCATMTLPRRDRAPSQGKVFLVNADYVPVPSALARGAVRVDHNVHLPLRPSTQRALAEDLLATYRDRARLVITTKIHCAMPCAAMGIPTVFIGDVQGNPRLEPVSRMLPVNQFRHPVGRVRRTLNRSRLNRAFLGSVDWEPPVVDYEDEKAVAIERFQEQLDRAVAR